MSFTNLLSWKSHENTHKGLQLQCIVCKEEFKNKKALKKHEEENHKKNILKETKIRSQNSNVVQYCESCDYYTTSKANLKRHVERKHSNKSPVENKEKNLKNLESAHTVTNGKENVENSLDKYDEYENSHVNALSSSQYENSEKETKRWMEIAEDWN